jgi:hypothetical protein
MYKGLYGAFVWARRALNSQKRRFPARTVTAVAEGMYANYVPQLELEGCGGTYMLRSPTQPLYNGKVRSTGLAQIARRGPVL